MTPQRPMTIALFARAALTLAVIAALTVTATAAADTRVLGSSLAATPGSFPGCETEPTLDPNSGSFDFQAYPSNDPDCTWYQSGVFGAAPGNTLTGGVPADGRITNIAIKAGATPARLRFVLLRQLVREGQSSCCFFVSETPEVQPQPNAVTNFPVDISVERNTNPDTGIITQDWIGISGVSGTGNLPIVAGPTQHTQFTNGKPATAFMYPRLGTQPGDSGGGRPDRAFSDAEILMQWTWTNDPATPPGTPAAAPGQPVVTAPTVPIAPPANTDTRPAPLAIPGRLLFATDGVVPLSMRCLLSTDCAGTATLRTVPPAGGAVAARLGALYGRAAVRIRAGRTARVKVKLNAAGRRALRRRRSLRLVATVTVAGQAAVTRNVTVKARPRPRSRRSH
jgi:hypothetical protein